MTIRPLFCLAVFTALAALAKCLGSTQTQHQYLLAGYGTIGNEDYYSIYNSKTNCSFWLTNTQAGRNISVVSFDREAKALHVLLHSNPAIIHLRKSRKTGPVIIKESRSNNTPAVTTAARSEIAVEFQLFPTSRRVINPRMRNTNSSGHGNIHKTSHRNPVSSAIDSDAARALSESRKKDIITTGQGADADLIQGVFAPPTDPNPRILSANELKPLQ